MKSGYKIFLMYECNMFCFFFFYPETLGMNGPKEQTYKLVKEQKQSPGAGEKVERLENRITPLID